MSRRKTVSIDTDICLQLAKKKRWKAVDLAEMIGKHRNWLSEVKRGRNLPSPEEAAQMCVLLDAEPEDILLATGSTDEETAKLQADIALVRELVEKQGIKKDLTISVEADKETAELQEIWNSADEDEKRALLEMARLIKSRRK